MNIKVINPEKEYVKLPYTQGKGIAKAVIWPGMGAKHGSMHYFLMEPGAKNVPHRHPVSEDMFYVLQGSGVIVDYDQNIEHPFTRGNFIYVPAGVNHAVHSEGPDDYISVGGPCPIDHAMYKSK